MRIGICAFVVSVLGALALLQSPSESGPEAGTYDVDGVHSSVLFKVKHAGIAWFYGRFNGISGSFTLGNDGKGEVDLSVSAASVDTGNEKRNGHLKSPDFFNAVEFPTITFKGALEGEGDAWTANGKLTLHGVTRDVEAEVERVGSGEAMKGFRTGLFATFTINRSDFGMKYGVDNGALGDEVEIIVSLEGVRK